MRWLGIQARIDVILHKIVHPTHNLKWTTNKEELCPKGDIVCETCNINFWCRSLD